jgi:cysteine synthase A
MSGLLRHHYCFESNFHQKIVKQPSQSAHHCITSAIGITPTVRLNRISPICESHNCFLKLESCNPGGSVKEKNAVYLVNQAEANGELKPGGTIIESSSGNFGVGLAIVGATRGYRVIIVIDAKTTPFFRRLLAAYGAEMVEVSLSEADASGSMQKARMKKAQLLSEEIPGAWYPCQHLNPENPGAHYQYTAREIAAVFGSNLDAIVVGVSTAGQIMGIAKYFHEISPETKIIGVDVCGSVIFSKDARPYKMTGVGLSFQPPSLNYQLVHSAYVIPESLAYSICHELAQKEGMLLGSSTGAIVAAGMHVAKTLGVGANVLMINPDRGDRYLETIYDLEWLTKNGFVRMSHPEIIEAIDALEAIKFAKE